MVYNIIVAFFYAVLVIVIIKQVLHVALSFGYNLKKIGSYSIDPMISIIVPAFNEERTIKKCIMSLLDLNYPTYEIIVIDDGSTDRTFEVVKTFNSPLINLVHQQNQGKPNALNNGIRLSKGEIIVTVDADTIVQQESLTRIANRFASDHQIGAVAGNIKVIQASGLLNTLQSAEYTVGINLNRKTQSMFGCVMVVPGPIAAMKKEAIQQVGLFSDDTFAEDFDVTMKLLKAGYKIEYEDRAIAYTDAPRNVEDLIKQRRRWYRGMFQVLDKHRGMYLRSKYGFAGMVGVPNLWFEATAPIINLALILLVLLSGLYVAETSISLIGLSTYLGLDAVIGVIALNLDPVTRLKDVVVVPLLSFYSIFLDGIRLMSFAEEMPDTIMVWETPKR